MEGEKENILPFPKPEKDRPLAGWLCLACGFVRGPVRGLVACPKCGSADLRPFAQERRP